MTQLLGQLISQRFQMKHLVEKKNLITVVKQEASLQVENQNLEMLIFCYMKEIHYIDIIKMKKS